MKTIRLHSLSCLIGLLVLCVSGHALTQPEPFDELWENGKPRPHVEKFTKEFNFKIDSRQFINKPDLRSPFDDRIRVHPMPLPMKRSDLEIMREGSTQIMRALVRFFSDVVWGDVGGLKVGPVPTELLRAVLWEEYLSLEGLRNLWDGKTVDDIRFLSGPDVIRGPDGKFLVQELNLGDVGGLGDYLAIREKFYEVHGYTLPHEEREDVLDWMVRQMLEGVKRDNVLALLEESLARERKRKGKKPDLESSRIRDRMYQLRIDVEKPSSYSDAWLENLLNGPITRILNFQEHYPEYRDGRKSYHTWLVADMFKRKGAKLANAPGTEILGQKALLPYVNEMIRHYLREEPILPVIPTRLIGDSVDADESVWMNRVMKWTNGAHGNGVFIISKMKPDKRKRAIQNYIHMQSEINDPSGYFPRYRHLLVMQDYVNMSVLRSPHYADRLVEFRPLGAVMGDGKYFAQAVPWGRTAVAHGPGFNNIERGASELVVIPVDDEPEACQTVLASTEMPANP